jgi:heat shock protein HslJ
MGRTLAAILLAALIVGGLAACQSEPTAAPPPTEALIAQTLATSTPEPTATAEPTARPTVVVTGTSSIEGTVWSLVAYGDPAVPTKVISGTTITAGFLGGNLVGNAGCNDYSATYEVVSDTLRIDAPTASGKECATPAGIMAQQAQYLELLKNTATWTSTADLMELKSTDAATALFFQRRTAAQP